MSLGGIGMKQTYMAVVKQDGDWWDPIPSLAPAAIP